MLISEMSGTERLVLDTHVWVWASGEAGGPSRIPESALRVIESAARDRRLFASATSVWELALKAARGSIVISGDLKAWIRDQKEYPGIRILPIDARLCVDSTTLPRWVRIRDEKEHRDPADRFIVATARRLNAVLMTADREIVEYAKAGNLRAWEVS